MMKGCHDHHAACHALSGHYRPSRGLHWVGLAVLATTFVRKGRGEPVFWFGLGALVTSLFMKHRVSLENAWPHRCRSENLTKRKTQGDSQLPVMPTRNGSCIHDTCHVCAGPDRDVCSCGYAGAEEATRVETLFDATDDAAADDIGNDPSPASNESNVTGAVPSAAQQPVSVLLVISLAPQPNSDVDTPMLQTSTVESRIDTLARAIEEIRLVSRRMHLIIGVLHGCSSACTRSISVSQELRRAREGRVPSPAGLTSETLSKLSYGLIRGSEDTSPSGFAAALKCADFVCNHSRTNFCVLNFVAATLSNRVLITTEC